MDTAIAMRLGGKLVRADEASYVTYIQDGLLCPYCHEPVHLRSGKIRQPYFAHFPNMSARQLEECELRRSSSGQSHHDVLINGSQGQRMEYFQQHFLAMVVCSVSSIHPNSCIAVINRQIEQVTSIVDPVHLQEVVSRTLPLINSRNAVNQRILDEIHNDLKVEPPSDLNLKIAKEALHYLQTMSSEETLTIMILYLLGIVQDDQFYRSYVSGQAIPYTFLWQPDSYTEIARSIRYYLLYMLVVIDWKAAFSTYESYRLLVPSPQSSILSSSPSNLSAKHSGQVSNSTTSHDSGGLNGVGTICGAVTGVMLGGPLGAAMGAIAGAAIGAWIKKSLLPSIKKL